VVTARAPLRAWAFDQFDGQIRTDRAARPDGTIVIDLEELRDAA
jgi:hypothetical protein